MNRAIAVGVMMCAIGLGGMVSAQEKSLAILKASASGTKSEARTISAEQLQQMFERRLSPQKLFEGSSPTDLDTIQNIDFGNREWRVASEESLLCYFDPPAPCYIKAVGIQVLPMDSTKRCDGFCLRLARTNYPWDFSSAGWQGDSLVLGVWKNNAWQGNNFAPPLGQLMWGDFPMTAVENTVCWAEMIFLGEEPDIGGEPFHVVIMPYGESGSYLATLATALEPTDGRDNLKLAHYREDGGWIVYNYALNWYVVVEYYGNKPPRIVFRRAGSTLETGSRMVTCAIVEEDAADPSKAGVREAYLHFSINKAAYDSVVLELKSGTIQDGIWGADIPGPRAPGDVVTYFFSAVDRGNPARYVVTYPVTYRIFKKEHDLLLITEGEDLKSFFPRLDYKYDYWELFQDGPIYDQLVRPYNYIIQCGKCYSLSESDDVIGNWIGTGTANEPKNYFLSSATWANVLANTRGMSFGPNDWHNVYLGIEALGPLDFSANAWSAFPLNAVAEDIVSGKIASFCGDSLQLHCLSREVDAFTPTKDAQVCFRDSARGLALGCHKEGDAFKTVFLSFDYRFLFTRPQFWITYHYDNLLGRVLEWFGTPVSRISEQKIALPAVFRLNQNYPNPFNSQTVIDYCILKPAKVQLTIFNLAGERVTTLINEHQAAQNYRIVWKAGDCPTGIYFCRLQVDGLSQTLKMILIN